MDHDDPYVRFSVAGICWCGNHFSKHARNVDELKATPIRCSLTMQEIPMTFARGATAAA